MEHEEYRRLRDHEERYWWHVGRRDLLQAMLRRALPPSQTRVGFDIGCGTGANFAWLARYARFFGSEVTGELWGGGLPRPQRPVVIARGESLPLHAESVGLCTFFDVLEHVEDDVGFLREVRRALVPGWSDHDVSLHHKRRYVRRTLQDVVHRAGLEIERITYGMATVFPLIAGWRLLTKPLPRRGPAKTSYVETPGPLNAFLVQVLRAEAALLERMSLPFGTSLFCLARRGETA
jgi:SAM-dependent methyltransferase